MHKAIKVLFIFNGIFCIAGGLLGPLYAIFAQQFNADVFQISISWSAFLISTTIFTFILSRFGDQLKRKENLLMAGFLVRVIAWVLYIFVPNIYFLIALQVFLGLGEAIGNPSFNAIFAEHLDRAKHIKEYADWNIVANLAAGVAALLGGLIVTQFGFNILFLMMAALGLVSFIGVYINKRSFSLRES